MRNTNAPPPHNALLTASEPGHTVCAANDKASDPRPYKGLADRVAPGNRDGVDPIEAASPGQPGESPAKTRDIARKIDLEDPEESPGIPPEISPNNPRIFPVQRALKITADFGTSDCRQFREEHFRRHSDLAPLLGRMYRRIAKEQNFVEANRWLLKTSKYSLRLYRTGLSITSDDESIRNYARAKARKNLADLTRIRNIALPGREVALMNKVLVKIGLSVPLDKKFPADDEIIAALARACDEKWLAGQLRTLQSRKLEEFIRRHGEVHRRGQIYVSDLSLSRFRSRKAKNKRLLERLEAENDEGQRFTLAELAKLSASNPEIRRAELMVRARGYEDIALNSNGEWAGVFYTLTCPSKHHPVLKDSCKPNPKYIGSTTRQAQDHLNTVWQRCRAAWARRSIKFFGMRVVEPHHAGTPHWHLLLFMSPERISEATEVFKHYALQVDGEESGAAEARLKEVLIDPERGGATSYIAKYISKNIDGYALCEDNYGHDAALSAERIAAWSSINGIRQFQQLGGPSITVWREIRRLDSETVEAGLLRDLIRAADEGNWEQFTQLMGGAVCARKDRPARPMVIEREKRNLYGETIRAVKGIWFKTRAVITRVHEWTIRFVDQPTESLLKESDDGVGFGSTIATAPPSDLAPLEFCQ